ncbi:MAG: CNP1-like family protein [Gammaproteobacteria bacterium]|nr:CNP1-like family protein [Gammaproteobacteria bacterium]
MFLNPARRYRLGVLLACLWICQPQVSLAEDEGVKFDFVEREPWKEQLGNLPAYPDGSHYVAVPVQIAGSSMQMFIDEPSLTLGDEGVVRYALLLRSPTGTENLFYEGIRCTTQEWRSYAYGTRGGAWQSLGETPWRPIRGVGFERYREQLFRYYLCNAKVGPLQRDEMLKRMRYGVPRDAD